MLAGEQRPSRLAPISVTPQEDMVHANPEPSSANRTRYYVEFAVAQPLPISNLRHFTAHIYSLHTIHLCSLHVRMAEPQCDLS